MTDTKQKYTEARKRANRKWDAANMKVISFKLLRDGDKDILEHIEKQPHKADYIRRLVREDIAREQKK